MEAVTQNTVMQSPQEKPAGFQDILESLVSQAYIRAKTLAGIGLGLDAVLYVGGVLAILIPALTIDFPYIAVPVSVIGFLLAQRSSDHKDNAEVLKRKHEYLMGFGVEPERSEVADMEVALSRKFLQGSESLLRQGLTYWSEQPIGPKRALQNLVQSAWFTKDLSGWCARWLGVVLVVSTVGSVSLLLACSTSLASSRWGVVVAKCVTSTILFLITARALRSCLAYRTLSRSAAAADQAAANLLAQNPEDAFAAQRLLAEYQVARACGPLIPTWVWRVRRKKLNAAWDKIKHPE